MTAFPARTLLAFAALSGVARASDHIGVYARVDKVILEPDTGAPDRIQIWGVFALAKPNDRNLYLPPARGYLYLKLADQKEAARREWTDLKSVAGTGQIVAFGSRHLDKFQVRKKDDKPENPDPYAVNFGLTKVRGRTDYPPVQALIDFKD